MHTFSFRRFVLSMCVLLTWTQTLWATGLERSSKLPTATATRAVPTAVANKPVLRPTNSGSGTLQTGAADLRIQSAQWSTPPAAGQQLGRNSILTIYLRNSGNVPAPATQLKVSCTALAGGHCPAGLDGTLDVPSMGMNQLQGMSWPSMSSSVWTAGKYRLELSLDPRNQVPESNEFNNKLILNVNIVAPLHAVSGLQKKPQLKAAPPQSTLNDISIKESLKFTSLTHSNLAPKTGDHVTSRLNFKSFYGDFTDVKVQCSRTIIPWSTGFKNNHKYEVLKIPSINTGESSELVMEWDAIEGSTSFQCVLEKAKPNNERIELYDEKQWTLPVSQDEQCQNGQDQLADIELVRFVYHYQTRDNDNQDYTIRWRNNSPKCVQVMRWKMINMEDGKEVTWGSYIGGGGASSIKGYDYQEIKGQVRKADIKKFRNVGGYWNLNATLKVVLDFDSIISESNESNNSDTATFEWHE